MRAALHILLFVLGLGAMLGLELVGLGASAAIRDGGPVIVVAPPWRGGAEGVVVAAGGRVVAPTRAPLSVVAAGASALELREAGAWLLLDPARLGFLCAEEGTP